MDDLELIMHWASHGPKKGFCTEFVESLMDQDRELTENQEMAVENIISRFRIREWYVSQPSNINSRMQQFTGEE